VNLPIEEGFFYEPDGLGEIVCGDGQANYFEIRATAKGRADQKAVGERKQVFVIPAIVLAGVDFT
jgi:hypothetical protein